MVILTLVLTVAAVLTLVFGTRKTVETHYVADRYAHLGGPGANTGTEVDTEPRRYIHETPLE